MLMVGLSFVRWHVLAAAPTSVQQAERALGRGENARARELLQRLLFFDPKNDRALLVTGVSFNADRRFPEAIAVLSRISENSDEFEQGGVALAATLIVDGDLERAEEVLARVIRRFPRSREPLDRLVRLFLQELRQREAIGLLENRWQRFPDDLSVLPDLLELQVKQASSHQRVQFLETVNKKYPRQGPVVLALARAYGLMGMTDKAEEWFEAAVELRPKDRQTLLTRAEFALEFGDLATAKALLESDELSSNNPEIARSDHYWWLRSLAAEQSHDDESALRHIAQALAIRPRDERYLLKQAALLRKMGKQSEAAALSQHAVELAEVRKRLLKLSNDLDRDRPVPDDCQEIAEALEVLGEPSQAVGWRRIRQAVLIQDLNRSFGPGRPVAQPE
ncbi:MAG: tetratricopeptide repeat protein [Planctomycetaceae bacterium]|nr:tetratricopeptide repeat protein [Planctomycetaceae bacterium]